VDVTEWGFFRRKREGKALAPGDNIIYAAVKGFGGSKLSLYG